MRMRFRFSIRSIAAFVIAFSLAMAIWTHDFRQAELRRAAIRALQQFGADVNVVGEQRMWNGISIPIVQGVRVTGRTIDEIYVANLRHMGPIRYAAFSACDIRCKVSFTEDQIESITSFSASFCSATDWSFLGSLTGLLNLSLIDVGLTNQDLLQCVHLKQLQFLSLDENPISDSGLLHLCSLGGLEFLSLNGTLISDKSIDCLGRMNALRCVSVENTQMTSRLSAEIPAATVYVTPGGDGLMK